ncbi:MAG: hypothetical protein H6712_10285 [Myxococcales bacterium]|nr:hypothetical protein [Myxococcales bacterium]
MEIERQVPSVTLYDPNVFANRVPDRARAGTYLVVEGGGKWGYDEDLRAYVDAVLVP